jgi:photosystem II stability/assembly factor-like uncharacterized protein
MILSIYFSFSQPPGWEVIDRRYDIPEGFTDSYYNKIKCADSLNCMIWTDLFGAGGYYIRRTTDGGRTWKNVFMDSAYSNSANDFKYVPKINEIAYPDEHLFIAVGDSGLILRTTDKGENWEKFSIGKNNKLKRLRMLDEKYGIMTTGIYPLPIKTVYMLETTDGGLTWNKMNMPNDNKIGFEDIDLVNRDLIAAIIWYLDPIPKKYLLWIHKNWESWDTLNIPQNTFFLDFINENMGWMSGGYSNSNNYALTTQEIYYTGDGGESWQEQRNKRFNGFVVRDIKFWDENFGITSSGLGLALITTDGGTNWQEDFVYKVPDSSPSGGIVTSPDFLSSNSAVVIYDGDSVFKYTRDLIQPSNHPPEIPIMPKGSIVDSIYKKYDYLTKANDIDGDSVSYFFDWGDSTVSVWSEFYVPDTQITASHSWNQPGDFIIKVKAKDTKETFSKWSNTLKISVVGKIISVEERNPDSLRKFTIIPNPTTDFIEVHNPNYEKISILNILGETIFTSSELSKIDVSSFPSGIYLVRIGGKVSKFVKI